jgi:alkylation response protein AidB-like acyl-CoA dehydrogenase
VKAKLSARGRAASRLGSSAYIVRAARSKVVKPREVDDAAMIPALALTAIPPQDEALRGDVRAFVEEAVAALPPDVRARSWMGFDAAFSRKLAARGWIGLTLPAEYGGGGRSAFARFVLVEELLAVGAPVSAHWIADRQSGPLILKYGTESQRRFYLPRICRAEAFFCIGMSEPDTGSDPQRATRDEGAGGQRAQGVDHDAHRSTHDCAIQTWRRRIVSAGCRSSSSTWPRPE